MATTDNEIDTLKIELTALRKDFGELKDTLKTLSKNEWDKGAASARSTGAQMRDYAVEGAHQVESGIQNRPMTSVLTAFGVGFVLGKLLDR